MQCSKCVPWSQRTTFNPFRALARRPVWCRSQSGRTEPFNEGAVQVKRLVDRDRKELLGNKIDILDKYSTEFGDPDDDSFAPAPAPAPASTSAAGAGPSSSNGSSSTSTSSSSAAPSSPFSSGASAPFKRAAVQTKFTGSSVSSPFGAPARTRSSVEPKGLSPDMSPDPIVKPAPLTGNFFSRITLTQVVLFFTFSSMIGLMLATFYVVLNTGAVRLAGIN